MLKTKYILLLLIGVMFVACRDENVDSPNLEVRVDNTTIKVQDSLRFYFDGDPDVITFYSGEVGHEYQFRERTFSPVDNVTIDFNSRVLYGSQKNNLRVMLSTNFNAIYDSLNVRKATWTNITDKFTLDPSAAGGTGANTPSGVFDVTDMIDVVDPSKPFYFAFQYVGEPTPAAPSTQRTWRITELNIKAKSPSGGGVLATLGGAAWLQVNMKNSLDKWSTKTAATQLQYTPGGELKEAEGWAISKPIYPTKIAPDLGVAIKKFELKKPSHAHKFAKPGVYTVTFVASNVTHIDQKTIVKEITITVEE